MWLSLKKENPEEGSVEQKIQNIFPFGNKENTDNTIPSGGEFSNNNSENTTDANTSEIVENKTVPRLRKISENPTSGSIVISREEEIVIDNKKQKVKKYFVRFVDRATGHVYETPTDSFQVTKLSNTTLPKIYEANFDGTGESFLARFLDDNNSDIIKTYSVTLKDVAIKNIETTASTTPATTTLEITPKETVGSYLDQDIKEYAFLPSKTKITYLLYKNDGSSIITSNLNGQNKKQIFESKLREWLLEPESETKIAIITKPSGTFRGFAYSLSLENGSLTKLFGNINGLTLKPLIKTDKYLVGEGGSKMTTYITSGSPEKLNVPTFNTLPEKCSQGKKDINTVFCAVPNTPPEATYPDDWYLGVVSFDDNIWKVDSKTNKTTFLFSPFTLVKENLDITNISISPDDNYLTFINKKDLSLWGLNLEKETVATSTMSATSTNKTK